MGRDLDQPRATPARLDLTRARPPPWFVGNGTGLMIGVLSLCGMLMLVLAASIFWLAERALEWWRTPVVHQAPPLQTAPTPPVPPVDRARANQPASGNPAAAFITDDYPAEAIRRNEEGRVVARLALDRSGTPRKCVVETSSGSLTLDTQTCRVALARLRYQPARDGRGAPIASTISIRIRWQLPV